MTIMQKSFQVVVMGNKMLKMGLCSTVFLLSACQSQPVELPTTVINTAPVVIPQPYTTPSGVTIIPYDVEPIIQKSL